MQSRSIRKLSTPAGMAALASLSLARSKMKRLAASFLTLALLLAGVGQAKADIAFSGYLFQSGDATSHGGGPFSNGNAVTTAAYNATGSAAQLASLGGLAGADAQFTTSSINYANPPAAYTAGSFLNNPTFTNQSFNFSTNAAYGAGASLNNTFIYLTATNVSLTAGQVISLTHDDGATLYLNGTAVINSPTPTSSRLDTFMVVTTGTYTINLAYGEVNGDPAVLRFSVTPEPATLTMAACGLVAFAGFKLRRRKPIVA